MNSTTQLAARLLPDGQLVIPGATPDAGATWQVLGSIQQEGVKMCFVRAELAGVSWKTLVPAAALERPDQGVLVTLAPQNSPRQEPLRGWDLFC